MTFEVTFSQPSEIAFKTTPEAGGQSITSSGKFQLSGKELISDAINKGKAVGVWLDAGQLVIQPPGEHPQRFTRK